MAVKRYFGDDMSLTVTTAGGNTVPVASLRQVTIIAQARHVELFTGDSTQREAVKKREFGVNVQIGIAAFDVVLAQQWLGGDTETAVTAYRDTSDVQLFDVTGTVDELDGSTTTTATVEDCYFAQMPLIDSSEAEYVTHNLTAVGKNVSAYNNA